jgi:hypothetical protein
MTLEEILRRVEAIEAVLVNYEVQLAGADLRHSTPPELPITLGEKIGSLRIDLDLAVNRGRVVADRR